MSLDLRPDIAPRPGKVILHLHHPSRLDLKQPVIEAVVSAITSRGWIPPDDEHWLVLCLEEVVVNAMLHGNEGDPRLHIDVELRADDTHWYLIVSDEGEGFQADDVPDHNDPESLLLEHGRGILLMHQWLDQLTYFNGGTTAFLARRFAGADDASPLATKTTKDDD